MTKAKTEGWVCPICNKGRRKRMNQKSFATHWATHKLGPIYQNKNITDKICCTCKNKLPVSNFRKVRKNGKLGYYCSNCRSCENKLHRSYSKKHPEWIKKNNHKAHLKWKTKVAGESCEICGEDRTLDVAHIIPRLSRSRCARNATYNSKDNILGLCPTHHRLFDEDKLYENEYAKIKLKVEITRKKHAKI